VGAKGSCRFASIAVRLNVQTQKADGWKGERGNNPRPEVGKKGTLLLKGIQNRCEYNRDEPIKQKFKAFTELSKKQRATRKRRSEKTPN